MGVRYLHDGNDDGMTLCKTTAQKMSFWAGTPVAQPSAISSATATATSAANAVNSVITALRNTGFIASS